eukprot:2147605-Prymnesium_polylepis.1
MSSAAGARQRGRTHELRTAGILAPAGTEPQNSARVALCSACPAAAECEAAEAEAAERGASLEQLEQINAQLDAQ